MYQGRQPQPILTCYDVGDTLEGLGAPILLPRVDFFVFVRVEESWG
jgi:hypothetical protein